MLSFVKESTLKPVAEDGILLSIACECNHYANATIMTMEDFPSESFVSWLDRSDTPHPDGDHRSIDNGLSPRPASPVSPNVHLGAKELAFMVSNGDQSAALQLGQFYFSGTEEVEKDQKFAVDLFRKAGLSGRLMLGKCYFEGEGIKQNKEIGLKCFAQATTYPDTRAEALRIIATCLLNGDGVVEDHVRALKYFILSGEEGDISSTYIAAQLLFAENKVQEAIPWLDRALPVIPDAAFQLGKLLVGGEPYKTIPKDRSIAYGVSLLTKAAESGHIDAQVLLGKHLINSGDKNGGYRFIHRAATLGDANAKSIIYTQFYGRM